MQCACELCLSLCSIVLIHENGSIKWPLVQTIFRASISSLFLFSSVPLFVPLEKGIEKHLTLFFLHAMDSPSTPHSSSFPSSEGAISDFLRASDNPNHQKIFQKYGSFPPHSFHCVRHDHPHFRSIIHVFTYGLSLRRLHGLVFAKRFKDIKEEEDKSEDL
jgi:hypothetical protein